ncbi:LysR family transcriptional regulator [Mesorhizobium sp. INR15]|uniref:LysR family transcriptional regulator n=1 Tax=Mesorhizobium sp. INR15 TaxID=2654248 RepID=UPI001896781B|nr:LysR family transcriptional regulator [Mesorhizobium sp. INR15]QPC92635.1 LysR family transcriptional regulator [Mesorhizobium sp. INR15]
MDAGPRYFIEVAKQGSFRAASDRLNVAASAISRQVKLLEEEFGAEFFQRSVKGIELTAAGEAFLSYAKGVEAERNRLRQNLDDLNNLKRGHVRISSIDGVVAGPLSDIIANFRGKHPGVTFDLRAMGTDAVIEDIRIGNADIGIAFHSPAREGVHVAHRVQDPLYAIVGISHHLAARDEITMAELAELPLALPDSTFGIRKLVDGWCVTQKLHLNVVLETNSIEALRGYARSGAGVTLLPFLSSRRDVETGMVKALRLDVKELRSSSVEVCVHADRLLPIAAEAFLKNLASLLVGESLDGEGAPI